MDVLLLGRLRSRLAARNRVHARPRGTEIRVVCDRAQEAALALTEAFGLRRVSLDDLLLRAIHAIVTRDEIDPALVHEADRAGRTGEDWAEIQGVVEEAAANVAKELFPASAPILLINPGLLARFQLADFLRTMAGSTRQRGCAAIFLLVPAHDGAGVPLINGERTIPKVGPPQELWVPPEWIKERRRAA
jgi:hypothetical protein